VLGPQASPPARIEPNQVRYSTTVLSEFAHLIRVARDTGRRGRLRSQHRGVWLFSQLL